MALHITNPDVERLVSEVSALTGETKTEAIRIALRERMQRLIARHGRQARIEQLLRERIWPQIPGNVFGHKLSTRAIERILGYGPSGV